ncbi:MAG: 1-acyl-sn-glycerol-3-phosphate acyltransferase [Clostridium sp.]|nr:1-acyl-sn-glycerol-3-phosphate acyltransferase [Clostridium sp.]
MIRLILVALVIVGFLVGTIPVSFGKEKHPDPDLRKQQEYMLNLVRGALRAILRMAGTKVEVKGRDHIPDDQAVLYVGNHRSYFDIVVGYLYVKGLTGFVAKKELDRIPLLSGWMRHLNCLFLDRRDIKAGLQTILEGIQKVKSGISMWIFPEGTRNESEDILELMPFKEGSLKIAEKSGCPVIPVAITGTDDIFEKHLPWIRPAQVTIEFGEPIYIKELPPELRKHVGAYTRDRIIELLKKEQQARRK